MLYNIKYILEYTLCNKCIIMLIMLTGHCRILTQCRQIVANRGEGESHTEQYFFVSLYTNSQKKFTFNQFWEPASSLHSTHKDDKWYNITRKTFMQLIQPFNKIKDYVSRWKPSASANSGLGKHSTWVNVSTFNYQTTKIVYSHFLVYIYFVCT